MPWRALFWTIGVLLGTVILALAAMRGKAAWHEDLPAAAAAPAEGRFVKAYDVSVFVQEIGPASGVPVLFVHGTGAWSECWRGVMGEVAKAGMRAIAIDLPPFGYSQRPEVPRYTKRAQGRRIVGVLDALGIESAVLVGHSFGGGPTMEAVLLAPGRVRAVVLVDAALSIGHDSGSAPEATPLALRAVLAVTPLRDSLVATFLTNPMFTRLLLQSFIDDSARATDEWVRVYQRPLAVAGTTTAVGNWLPALLAPGDTAPSELPKSYRDLRLPLRVIWGDRDSITPLAQGERIAKLVPGATLTVLKGIGHIPQIEDPRAFNETLLDVLAKTGL